MTRTNPLFDVKQLRDELSNAVFLLTDTSQIFRAPSEEVFVTESDISQLDGQVRYASARSVMEAILIISWRTGR